MTQYTFRITNVEADFDLGTVFIVEGIDLDGDYNVREITPGTIGFGSHNTGFVNPHWGVLQCDEPMVVVSRTWLPRAGIYPGMKYEVHRIDGSGTIRVMGKDGNLIPLLTTDVNFIGMRNDLGWLSFSRNTVRDDITPHRLYPVINAQGMIGTDTFGHLTPPKGFYSTIKEDGLGPFTVAATKRVGYRSDITVGRVYTAIWRDVNGDYRVIDDKGELTWFEKDEAELIDLDADMTDAFLKRVKRVTVIQEGVDLTVGKVYDVLEPSFEHKQFIIRDDAGDRHNVGKLYVQPYEVEPLDKAPHIVDPPPLTVEEKIAMSNVRLAQQFNNESTRELLRDLMNLVRFEDTPLAAPRFLSIDGKEVHARAFIKEATEEWRMRILLPMIEELFNRCIHADHFDKERVKFQRENEMYLYQKKMTELAKREEDERKQTIDQLAEVKARLDDEVAKAESKLMLIKDELPETVTAGGRMMQL